MEQTNITINNNTSYSLTIQGTGPGNLTVNPNSSTSWSSTEDENDKSLLFWEQENVWYMEGSLIFGLQEGVTFDRGNLSGDQNLALNIACDGLSLTQLDNNESGANLVLFTPEEFNGSKTITLTFGEK